MILRVFSQIFITCDCEPSTVITAHLELLLFDIVTIWTEKIPRPKAIPTMHLDSFAAASRDQPHVTGENNFLTKFI